MSPTTPTATAPARVDRSEAAPGSAAVPRPLVTLRGRSGRAQPAASRERGSQTMEYALIVIVAATIAMLALTWARIKVLLDAVMAKVMALFGIGRG